MSEIIDTVKNAFKERLDKNSWVDDTTRQASKDKVDAITKMVAYPDQLSNTTYLNELYAEVSLHVIVVVYFFSVITLYLLPLSSHNPTVQYFC